MSDSPGTISKLKSPGDDCGVICVGIIVAVVISAVVAAILWKNQKEDKR